MIPYRHDTSRHEVQGPAIILGVPFAQTGSGERLALPVNPATPVIMLGATAKCIAPFWTFLQQRKASGATGDNWLLLGDDDNDAPYAAKLADHDAIMDYIHHGVLTRLDAGVPFTPSQRAGIGDRMFANARGLWAWIDLGACVYLSGEPQQIAELQAILTQLVAEQGRMSDEQAMEYVREMTQSLCCQGDASAKSAAWH